MLTLLALPPELLGQILLFLPPEDIITCSKVNSQLRSLISSSVGLQYSLALDAARAEDNPLCIDSIASKLQALKNSENAWKSLDSKRKRKVKVTYLQSGVYDLSSGIYLLSDHGRRRLYTIDLNSLTPNTPQASRNAVAQTKPDVVGGRVTGDVADVKDDAGKVRMKEEIIKWKKVESDKFIVDLGLCVYEHDLIALVTTAPLPFQAGEHPTYEIAIDLRQLSTDTPHPRAKNPTLFVMNSRHEKPAIGIEIVGKHLVLILTFNHPDRPQDRVFIFQWMDGVLKASFEERHRTYSGLLFLDTELVCLPNAHGNSLDVFRIPEAPTLESPKPIVRLGLPSLRDSHIVGVISCRAEPNPVHPDSFAEMRAHSAHMRQEASTASLDAKFAGPSETQAPPSGDEPNVTHDASKVALGQAFQRATVAASEHALCMFELHILALQLVMVPGGGLNMNFQFRHRMVFVTPRSALLEAVAAHEARLEEQDRFREEKERLAALAKAEKEKERKEREKEAEDRKRKRAMEAGPSRARANSPSVEEFVRQRKQDADEGDNSGQAGSLFGRTDWPPADVQVDDDHDERPYVPFGEGGQPEGGVSLGQNGEDGVGDVAVSRVTAERTDVAGPDGETTTVVGAGNIQPDIVDDEDLHGGPSGPSNPPPAQNAPPVHPPPFPIYISPVMHHGAPNPANPVGGNDSDAAMPELMDLSNSDIEEEDSDGDSDGGGGGLPAAAAAMGFGFNGASRRNPATDRILVPWKDWNVGKTRWFDTDEHVTHWITTSAGERLVRMADHTQGGAEEVPSASDEDYESDGGVTHGSAADPPGAWDGDGDGFSDGDFAGHPRMRVGAPFSVLDFNPRRVAAMRRWVEEQKKPVVRGLRRPAPRREQAEGSDEEDDEEGTGGRDRALVASDGEAPSLGHRADGLRRRQRNVRRLAKDGDKGKGKAKEDDWPLKRKMQFERDQHVVGLWRVHKRDRKGKGREKPVPPPVPEFVITVSEGEDGREESDSEPVLSTGYAVAIDDEFPEQPAQADASAFVDEEDLNDSQVAQLLDFIANTPLPVVNPDADGPSTSASAAPETNADTHAAAQAMDEYLAQFDDDDDDEYVADQEADEEDEMDLDGDFMDFIEQNGDEDSETENGANDPLYFYHSEDSDADGPSHDGVSAPAPQIDNPLRRRRRVETQQQFLATGGHLPASLVLGRPPPDSLWVVPGGDLFGWEQVFAEPIVNGLPYVMCTSQRRYLYDGIMLDEDRVIGTKANEETHRIEFIDLHYFA